MADEVKKDPVEKTDTKKQVPEKTDIPKEKEVPATDVQEKPVPEPVKEKVAVKFYFPKSARKVYRTPKIQVKAFDHIYIVDPADKKYDEILDFLRVHPENASNGGRVFTELGPEDEGGDTDRGKLIDKLLDMSITQLRHICGDDIKLERVQSKGQLIDIYLKQQNL